MLQSMRQGGQKALRGSDKHHAGRKDGPEAQRGSPKVRSNPAQARMWTRTSAGGTIRLRGVKKCACCANGAKKIPERSGRPDFGPKFGGDILRTSGPLFRPPFLAVPTRAGPPRCASFLSWLVARLRWGHAVCLMAVLHAPCTTTATPLVAADTAALLRQVHAPTGLQPNLWAAKLRLWPRLLKCPPPEPTSPLSSPPGRRTG